jgi:hypothetical protein
MGLVDMTFDQASGKNHHCLYEFWRVEQLYSTFVKHNRLAQEVSSKKLN